MNPTEIGSGVVSGGDEYVWAAYAVSWVLLVGYVLLLRLRMPRGDRR